ncbi:hypothetical protein T01_10824 [Trichinella spiralis]|uniref:Uncharacterized protein n=1 Tax=Trichinella spiralis TaxID=6334 RepID=A0A0V1B4E3_TRISP|nr:hypothetical protein T01_10824 [Trichinella spiralis]
MEIHHGMSSMDRWILGTDRAMVGELFWNALQVEESDPVLTEQGQNVKHEQNIHFLNVQFKKLNLKYLKTITTLMNLSKLNFEAPPLTNKHSPRNGCIVMGKISLNPSNKWPAPVPAAIS